jgi:protein subunit release factor B
MFHILSFNSPCRRYSSAFRHEIVTGELIQSLFSLVNVASLSKNTKRPPQDKLDERDIVETFCRGAGPGGQKINKSMNKVRLRHIPTGATVAVQEQRDLTTNRSLARKLLRDKVDLIVNGSNSKIARRISKIQKRKSKTAM